MAGQHLFYAAVALAAAIFCGLQNLPRALLNAVATIDAATTPFSPFCEYALCGHDSVALLGARWSYGSC